MVSQTQDFDTIFIDKSVTFQAPDWCNQRPVSPKCRPHLGEAGIRTLLLSSQYQRF